MAIGYNQNSSSNTYNSGFKQERVYNISFSLISSFRQGNIFSIPYFNTAKIPKFHQNSRCGNFGEITVFYTLCVHIHFVN